MSTCSEATRLQQFNLDVMMYVSYRGPSCRVASQIANTFMNILIKLNNSTVNY